MRLLSGRSPVIRHTHENSSINQRTHGPPALANMGGIMPFLPLDQPTDCLTCKEEVMVEQSDGFVCCSQCGRILGDIDESSDNDPVPGPIKTRTQKTTATATEMTARGRQWHSTAATTCF